MRERLELKILTLVLVLLVIGILAAGIMVLTIEKKSLYIITGSSLESSANIIAKDIARTMLDGKAEVTRDLMQELRGIRGIGLKPGAPATRDLRRRTSEYAAWPSALTCACDRKVSRSRRSA